MWFLVLLLSGAVTVPLTLFGVVYALVQSYFGWRGRADRRQQEEYERQEWERHVGRDRATLLRGAVRLAPALELPHASGRPEESAFETLLRAQGVSAPKPGPLMDRSLECMPASERKPEPCRTMQGPPQAVSRRVDA